MREQQRNSTEHMCTATQNNLTGKNEKTGLSLCLRLCAKAKDQSFLWYLTDLEQKGYLVSSLV